MLFVVIGATGKVGGVVARTLLAEGHRVRVVLRNAGQVDHWRAQGAEVALADLHDRAALRAALRGGHGLFAMNPPAYASEDMLADARKVCVALKDAAAVERIERVVALSSVGAQHDRGTGNILTTHLLEQVFGELACPTAFLRAAWFMENALGFLPLAREQGVAPSFLMPLDRAIPQVATRDIGRTAAALLAADWRGRRIVELAGLRDCAPVDVASALGRIAGRPVEAVPFPRDAWPGFFARLGMSASAGLQWAEMIDGFNAGHIAFEGTHERMAGREELVDAFADASA
ncbi:MAG: NmrA family NAD(P)-binding protein [Lysobacteraceae bacterium]